MRWTDAALFNQEPPIGVESGIIPWSQNQRTRSAERCPASVSHTSTMRKGGSGRPGA
jgi:hypothetical protein